MQPEDADPLPVTVVAGARRADLLLPGALPVAELLPDLARTLGLLGPDVAQGTLRLRGVDGRPLSASSGLAGQGVTEGAVLGLAVETHRPSTGHHDDLSVVVADVVEHDLTRWEDRTGGQLAGVAGTLCLALALLGMLTLTGPVAAAAAATVSGASVLGGSFVVRRSPSSPLGPVLGWIGVAYAGAAGALAPVAGSVALGTGVALVLAGAVVMAAWGGHRRSMLAAPVTGGVVLLAGLVSAATPLPVALVLTSTLVLVVVLGDAVPWLAAACVGLAPQPVVGRAPPAGLHRASVARDVRAAHELLVGLSVATGLLLVGIAPAAVSLGPWGTLLALACAVVVHLRAGRHRVRAPALVGRASGAAAVATTGAAALWWHPGWRAVVVTGLVAAGVLAVARAATAFTASVRWGRLAEVVETVALLSVPPLLVAASGLLPLVRGWVS
ncbi:MAG TPA: type VII secretion integral membrane protein EccD [Nocardioides sp.]|nr:type VII secretion integral membrane protein EccD [Nocardioides sp.]